jgi:hypothetical protein
VDDLDQIHIPDPVAQEFAKLNAALASLKEELAALREEPQKTED